MKEINNILKELDDAILIHPNELTDGTVSELPHYHFVRSKVKTIKNPLWNQALQNVSAKSPKVVAPSGLPIDITRACPAKIRFACV